MEKLYCVPIQTGFYNLYEYDTIHQDEVSLFSFEDNN